MPSTKGFAYHRKESVETLREKDQELLRILKQTTKEKEYDMMDHTRCYIRQKKINHARDHICGGVRDVETNEISKKCLHCRFFFPVPTFKDVTKK